MGKVEDSWVMRGVSRTSPDCIHSVDEAIEYIDDTGFLPLFSSGIPGFSLEERTAPEDWWTEDPERDPWMWRQAIAASGRALYGKFFNKKAGFISKKWFPVFANYRRDGYDFDALWDDERASHRQKKIMDLFADENSDSEYFSYELRRLAGYGKDGEKGFESVVSSLQADTYLCIRDFRRRINSRGEPYGWNVAVLCTPEHIWGRDLVTSAYVESPKNSRDEIVAHIKGLYSGATDRSIKSLLLRPEG